MCNIEFGQGRVDRVDIDFVSGPTRTGTFNPPSAALVAEKEQFGSSPRTPLVRQPPATVAAGDAPPIGCRAR
jgi:hypothetical protein